MLKLNQYDNNNDKIWAIFKWLETNISYNKAGIPTNRLNALIKGYGICQDYANCAEYLCYLAGIECWRIGSLKHNHEWNVVKGDGNKYYHCDAQTGSLMLFSGKDLEKYLKKYFGRL